ncbi:MULTISPECIES: hypothetical protein [Shewanella]|uniref:hypothetical protein n=1 Tax=Shewanella TaxID=22 RepID=UPI0021DAC8BC|nr:MULTISPECIES: hypothetical protein [unclassified Shewanella]MCU8055213.1 hypothetical protein [Shewanella sp. SM35]MCU8063775.1 hypothetical protein [Shewanella sp. SM34]MCU8073371.1 hypothetical protein [Shewanella sp. SM29]MCU8090509.1 hypothetical protein [Shewanella sp. SM20]
MNQEAIREAIDNLELLNIKLRGSSFQVNEEIEGVIRADMQQQSMLHIEGEVIDDALESSNAQKTANMLQVKITLGTRYILKIDNSLKDKVKKGHVETSSEPTELAKIEATFLLEYLIKGEINDSSIKEFCEFNSVHNCWSFWREHVFSVCQKAHIPVFSIPFFKSTNNK